MEKAKKTDSVLQEIWQVKDCIAKEGDYDLKTVMTNAEKEVAKKFPEWPVANLQDSVSSGQTENNGKLVRD